MKVIFLDFDGVLNSDRYMRTCGESGMIIDPSRMELLKILVEKTGAKIVLSTSWREHWEKDGGDEIGDLINSLFAKYRLEIFDKTPHINTWREEQIAAWLDAHTDTENFVVLDDMFLAADFLAGHFIRTSNLRQGFDENDLKVAIEILNKI